MKLLRIALVLMFIFVAVGCASQQVQESEFWEHPSMFKNWDHLKYSVSGFSNPTPDDVQNSREQGWWGIPTGGPATK